MREDTVNSAEENRKSLSANSLLPVIYEELRKLARAKMAIEPSDLSLQPSDLVHAAYLRLVENEQPTAWNNRGHFFGAAANAMRRILVENARRKKSQKRGGHLKKLDLAQSAIVVPSSDQNVLLLDEALQQLQLEDPEAAKLVELRFFVGLTINETAELMKCHQGKPTWSGHMLGPGCVSVSVMHKIPMTVGAQHGPIFDGISE